MSRTSFVRLFALAALWGGSFLFIRVAAQELAPAPLMFARVAIAALFLVVVGARLRLDRARVAHYAVVGIFNSAVPFVLIAAAAHTLGAGVCSILNASSPAFAALIGAFAARRAPPARVLAGLALGLAGVVVVAGAALAHLDVDRSAATLAVIASLTAALSYGVAAVYARGGIRLPFVQRPKSLTAKETALGSMAAAAVALAIPAASSLSSSLSSSSSSPPSAHALVAVVLLGVFCTGAAYVLYFRLIDDEGPTAALSVTFLVPIFGVAWSALFLGEPVSLRTVLGAALVLAGTVVANRATTTPSTTAPEHARSPVVASVRSTERARVTA